MNKEVKVFMLNNGTGERPDSRLLMDNIYTIKEHVAERLETEGTAVRFEGIPELDQFDKDISNEVGRFKKAYEKLEKSKDPRYKDPDFFAEEAGKTRKELDEKVETLQTEYAEMVQSMKEAAQRDRANLTRPITPDEEKGARQLMDELVSVAKLSGIERAFERIEADMKYYSDGKKAALANEIHRLVDIVDDGDSTSKHTLRTLSNKLREDTEGVELAARMTAALPDTVGTDYSTLRLSHREYKGRGKSITEL